MMKSSSRRTRTVLAILLVTICNLLMYHSLLALESRQVIVSPDALPTAVKVRLDDISLCELRNIRRRELQPPLPDLTCDANNPQLDPEMYTMDEYVLGVLKQEVGPDATIAHWHIEALKSMAVTARTYGWYHATSLGAGTYEIRTLYLQAFFPEKNVSPDETRYQQAVVATTGLYMSHPTGKGAEGVIDAEYRLRNGDPTNPCSLNQGTNCPTPPDACPGLMLPYFMDAYLVGVLDSISQGENRSQVDCNSPGLSQYGVQRWAIGNSDAGADPTSPNFPRLNYMQILTHYYTGIHILDDNQSGAAITPQRRWVPLTVHWQAPYEQGEIMYRGQTYTVTFQIQNTGTITWNDITQYRKSHPVEVLASERQS